MSTATSTAPAAPALVGSTTVTCLPAVAFDDTLAFWELLGFEVTLRQRSPNSYGVVRSGDVELHLYGLPGLEPEKNFSTCLVLVGEVETLHEAFRLSLEEHLGRKPFRGLPRLSRMRPGQTRFTVTDTSGNSVIFIERSDRDDRAAAEFQQPGLTPMQRAVTLAERKRDFKTDDAGAARILDAVIARHAGDTSADYVRAVEARLELAELYDEDEVALRLRELRRSLPGAPAPD